MAKNIPGQVVLDEAQLKSFQPKNNGENDTLKIEIVVPLGDHGKDLESLSDMLREGAGGTIVTLAKKQVDLNDE